MPVEDTWDRTLGFLLWTQGDMTDTEIQENASDYWFVWSAAVWQADDFRIGNPQSGVGSYLPGFLDDENGRPNPYLPEDDSPELRARTLLWWNTEVDGVGHPDWILYLCDGETPAYQRVETWPDPPATLPNAPLDMSNPDVIEWQLRGIEGMQPGFTAFSADLIDVRNWNHACGVYRDGDWVQLFTGEPVDPAFSVAVLNWAKEMRSRLYAQAYPKGLVVNFSLDPNSSADDVASLAASVDGILDEQGFTAFGLGRRYVSWLQKIEKMIEIQNQGIPVYSVNYVESYPPTQDELEWILGSFLMAREHAAYILITGIEKPEVRWPHLPEFAADLGHPCAPMTESQDVYVRDYSNGMAVVNPSLTSSYTFTLPPESFTDLYETPVEGYIDLEPLTGRVLLSSEPRCP